MLIAGCAGEVEAIALDGLHNFNPTMDEANVVAGGRESTAEDAADPAGADDSDFH